MKLGRNRVRPRTFQNNKKLVTKTLSEYNVISNFSPIVSSKIRFFTTFFTFRRNKRKFYTGIQNWMLILIFGSKSSFGNDLRHSDAKKNYFTSLFGQMPLRNSIAMAIPEVLSDQKLLERVRYTLIRKFTNFQLPTPNSF